MKLVGDNPELLCAGWTNRTGGRTCNAGTMDNNKVYSLVVGLPKSTSSTRNCGYAWIGKILMELGSPHPNKTENIRVHRIVQTQMHVTAHTKNCL